MQVPVDARRLVIDLLPSESVGAEIGVFRGEFSRQILKYSKVATLHLVDPWINRSEPEYQKSLYASGTNDMEAIYKGVVQRFRDEQRVQIHRMSSRDFASRLPDQHLDFVYIDGDHHYEAVKADLDAFWPKVKVNGLICLDDYSRRGWWRDGVIRAVHEFLASHPILIKST